jgi:hypothetical protein
LLAANFQLLGLAGESLLKLLATTAAASDLLDFVLCLGHSSLVRLPVFGEFIPCSLEFSAFPRNRVLLLIQLLDRQLMLTDLLGQRLIAAVEFLADQLSVVRQAFGRGSQQVLELRGQIAFDLLQPRLLGREKLLGACPLMGGSPTGRRPARRGIGLRFMLFHVRP